MSGISHDYMEKHLSKLVGFEVKGFSLDDTKETIEEFGEPVYGLLLRNLKTMEKRTAWIMADPEGNGPGFLDIQ